VIAENGHRTLVKRPIGPKDCSQAAIGRNTVASDLWNANVPIRRESQVTQIFLSYRTDDEPFAAAFFDQELTREFGDDAVFFASRSIPLGADWEKTMFDAVFASDAMLVVIGPRWMTATDEDGQRRLDNPKDFVRREVELGLQLRKQIIPVHLERRHRLEDDPLPESLRALADKQSTVVQFRNSKPDLARLVTQLRRQIPSLAVAAPNEPRPGVGAPGAGNGTRNTFVGQAGNVIQGNPIGGIFLGGTPSGT
jgi:TIR domain-containing protein